MKLLVDAQLPAKICEVFTSLGFDCLHVDALPKGDETPDAEIAAYADLHGFVVVTKDSDFFHAHMVKGWPARLLLITAGNMKNRALFDLIRQNALALKNLLPTHTFLELSNQGLVAHH